MRIPGRWLPIIGCALMLSACSALGDLSLDDLNPLAPRSGQTQPAADQPAAPAPATAAPAPPQWPQAQSDVPADDSVLFGQLPNGMRYAVMRNATPPGQAALRMHVRAGSLMETEDQLGLAHFMEHMVFNGSTNFPEGEMIRTLERLGLAFGPDTNAFTSFDQTVYQLDLPRADATGLDTAFRVLRDMAGEADMAADAIDRERGVVISEERTRDSPALRAARARYDFLMRGQLAPRRFPIGETSVLSSAPRERFARFYEAYYRPERTTLVAVGDFDPADIEARIQAVFGDWRNAAPDGGEPDLGPVAPREAEARLFIDPGSQASVQMAWVSPPTLTPDGLEERRLRMIRSLGLGVLTRRLGRLARSEAPPFTGASANYATDLDSIDMASLYANVAPGAWRPALEALEQEQRRIREFGVTEAELRREITERRTALETYVAGAGTRRTPALADGLVGSVHAREVHTAPYTDLLIFDSVVDGLTAAEVSAALRQAFDGDGPLIFVASPVAIEGGAGAVMAALAESAAAPVQANVGQEAPPWPYDDFGPAGQVAERDQILDLDVTSVAFDNGVRLTIKPTNFRNDQVLVAVRVGHGYSAVSPSRPNHLWAARTALIEGGLGQLTAEQIEETLAADVYRASFAVAEDAFVLNGATRPDDLAVQLQILTAYLTDPAWRPEAFERIRRVYAQSFDQLRSTPGGVNSREGAALLRSGDRRWAFPTPEQVRQADGEAVAREVQALLASGPVEVVVVGDVDVDQAIQAVGDTLGALPPRSDPGAAHTTQRFPAPVAAPVTLTHAGRADQGMALIAWPTPDFVHATGEARLVRVLSDVLRLRLLDELREAQGVTYSPSVSAFASSAFEGYGYLSAGIEAPPERLDAFFADVQTIARDLAQTPISADELERARRPRIEQYYRGQSTNEFWMTELMGLSRNPTARLAAIRSAAADLERITPADIQRAAAEYLTPSAAWRMIIAPEAAAE